jgi:hypothetical protein
MRSCLKYPLIALFLLVIFSCKKRLEPAIGIDKEMFLMAIQSSDFTWYKNDPTYLGRSSGSGHSYSMLRTRYNAIAAAMLDSNGKVKEGASFPEGSFIVKELSNDNTPGRYAMLLKRAAAAEADEKGWVWGYVNSDERVVTAASEKGDACKGCHNQEGSIDYMLMNKFFP